LAGTDSYTTADGNTLPYRVAWSADGQRLTTFSTVPSNPAEVAQVWNADGSLAATSASATGMTSETALSADGTTLALTSNTPSRQGRRGQGRTGPAARRRAAANTGRGCGQRRRFPRRRTRCDGPRHLLGDTDPCRDRTRGSAGRSRALPERWRPLEQPAAYC